MGDGRACCAVRSPSPSPPASAHDADLEPQALCAAHLDGRYPPGSPWRHEAEQRRERERARRAREAYVAHALRDACEEAQRARAVELLRHVGPLHQVLLVGLVDQPRGGGELMDGGVASLFQVGAVAGDWARTAPVVDPPAAAARTVAVVTEPPPTVTTAASAPTDAGATTNRVR